MPVYKDEKAGTWYVKLYYTDYTGAKKQKMKRGFSLLRDAKDWERKFLEQFAKTPTITFETLYEKYEAYIKPRVRESTYTSRISRIKLYILPYFKDRIVAEITPADIIEWQNDILKMGLSDTYLNRISGTLNTIFNYAVNFHGLSKTPCKNRMGTTKARNVDFWTPDEYKQFIDACRDNIEYFTMFEILYYTGIRRGELLALTLGDIDLQGCQININKTYYRGSVHPPKTSSSNRTVLIPGFLANEIREYITHLYSPEAEDRLFEKTDNFIRYALIQTAKKAGVKQIRVHDLRHSHASMLINLGANPVLIAERLGHESPDITLKVYAHLFPSAQADIVRKIEKLNK